MTDPLHVSEQDWGRVETLKERADSYLTEPYLCNITVACCLVELRDRVVALEAAGDVAGNPVHASVAPVGVTIHELTRTLEHIGCDSGHADFLWNDSRIGPLLRGEGAAAPKRVVLPDGPPINTAGRSLTELAFMAYRDGCRDAWASARAEVKRQQGGQVDD